MSHIAQIKCEILDLNILKKAVENFGGQLKLNQKTHKWYGRWVGDTPMPDGMTVEELGKCDHAISFPNAQYEIGVIKDKYNPNKYNLFYDYYFSGGLDKVVGEGAGRLVAQYEMEQVMNTAIIKGKTFIQNFDNKNKKLTLTINMEN